MMRLLLKRMANATLAPVVSALLLPVGLTLLPPRCMSQQQRPVEQPVPKIAAALHAQRFEQALQLCREALRSSPADPRLWTLQAIAEAGSGNQMSALASFQHALKVQPDFYPAAQGYAQLAESLHRPEAQSAAEHLLAIRPGDQVGSSILGSVAFQRGDCDAAVKAFTQAQQPLAQPPATLAEYSDCLVKLSRFDEAVPVFKQILQELPSSTTARHNVALALWYGTHNQEAMQTLAPLLAQEHPDEEDLTLAATIAEAEGDTPQALTLLRRAILLYPKKKDAYLDFVNLSYQHGSAQVGLDIVNIGIQQMPDEGELRFARGVLQAQFGHLDQAMEDLKDAQRLNPTLSTVGAAEGIVESQNHNGAAAVKSFREQVRAHPDDALSQYLLAEALSETSATPGTPGYAEALRVAHRAVQLNSKQVKALDLLATILLAGGDVAEAASQSRAALTIQPDDQQALYHLILALRSSPHKEEIPALAKRLMQAREEEQSRTERQKVRKLVEQSNTTAP